jgi:hypothetical protein
MLWVRCSTLPKLQATSGVWPSISSGEVPHRPYADDTILLIENDEDTILIVKLLLYYYEAIVEFKKGTTRKVKFLAWVLMLMSKLGLPIFLVVTLEVSLRRT